MQTINFQNARALVKGKDMGVKNLYPPFRVAFKIKPVGTRPLWRNVFMYGSNHNRALGVWVVPKSTKLHVRIRTGRNANDGCDPTHTLAKNQWTQVEIFVTLKDMTIYLYVESLSFH